MEKLVRVSFFGPFKIETDMGILTQEDINSPLILKFLSYLILNRHSIISPDVLSTVLWHDETDNPYASLRALAFRARRAIRSVFPHDDFIMAGAGTYQINSEYTIITDTEELPQIFSRLKATGDYKEAADFLNKSGHPFCKKIATDMWGLTVETYYNSQLMSLLCHTVELLLSNESYDDAIKLSSMGLTVDSLSERLHSYIIKALKAQGHISLAREHYNISIQLIYKEHGFRPSAILTDSIK